MGEDRKRASSLSRSTVPAAARRGMRLQEQCGKERAEVRRGEKGPSLDTRKGEDWEEGGKDRRERRTQPVREAVRHEELTNSLVTR
eukprot:503823-Heterocapsa_arctica.AAC.1